MANITLAVDEPTYRRARLAAAARGQSVSALVRDYLHSLAPETPAEEKTTRLFAALDAGGPFRAATRLTREDAHVRRKS